MFQLFAFSWLYHFFYLNLFSVNFDVLVEFFIFCFLSQLFLCFRYRDRLRFFRFSIFLLFFGNTSFSKLTIDFLSVVRMYPAWVIFTLIRPFICYHICDEIRFGPVFNGSLAAVHTFLFVQHNCALDIKVLFTWQVAVILILTAWNAAGFAAGTQFCTFQS